MSGPRNLHVWGSIRDLTPAERRWLEECARLMRRMPKGLMIGETGDNTINFDCAHAHQRRREAELGLGEVDCHLAYISKARTVGMMRGFL